jgi:hypothetical protein
MPWRSNGWFWDGEHAHARYWYSVSGDELTVEANAMANKYHNQPVSLDDHRFGSQAEARRWYELQTLERAGAIRGLVFHPRYVLLDSFQRDGKTIRGIVYEADAWYEEDGRWIVEDTKGMETDVFILKRKLFLARYPDLELRIVKA